eukprot:1026380-Rhodomonas_salina.3
MLLLSRRCAIRDLSTAHRLARYAIRSLSTAHCCALSAASVPHNAPARSCAPRRRYVSTGHGPIR